MALEGYENMQKILIDGAIEVVQVTEPPFSMHNDPLALRNHGRFAGSPEMHLATTTIADRRSITGIFFRVMLSRREEVFGA